MWAQHDHVVPHARGGSNHISNLVVTCASCNYGRMNYTLGEAALQDPRSHPPRNGAWSGLQEVLP
jgi:5-methylcytosine-specific restriction endonuclease McrA